MVYIPMALIIIMFTIFNANINMLQSNQKRIESKLNIIIEHLGLSDILEDELKDELIRLVEDNQRIKAIKKLRDATGMGLKEAKDYVDGL